MPISYKFDILFTLNRITIQYISSRVISLKRYQQQISIFQQTSLSKNRRKILLKLKLVYF